MSSAGLVDRERPPIAARPWSRERILGVVLLAAWAAAGLGLAGYLVSAWNPELIARYGPSYLSGLGVTLSLVALSILLGAILSLPVAYARASQNRVLAVVSYAYVYFFRGTPLLVQTYLVYYGLGSFRAELQTVGLWDFFKDAFNCGVFAFALNTAAYQAEILRGAIESVPRGQWEGAASLGLHKLQTLRKIILPQALIVALRPYGNELILMVKASAIVAIITVYDLMGQAKLAFANSFDIQAYIWVAVVYLVMVEILRHGIEWIERRITIHLKR